MRKVRSNDLVLTRDEFSTISSLSKLSFFYDISRFSIYDSRAIYSLNWLLFKFEKDSGTFFPTPNGRNAMITAFPVENPPDRFWNYRKAYSEYNKLLIELASKIFKPQTPPFYIEMILFGIASTKVQAEVNIKLNIWD